MGMAMPNIAPKRVWNREQRRKFDRFLQSAEGKAAAARAKALHTKRAQEAAAARAILIAAQDKAYGTSRTDGVPE